VSQTYTANCFISDGVAQTDLANVETNFATLRSTNSGNAAPANAEAGLQWLDLTTGTHGEQLLKVYNAGGTVPAGNTWLAVLCGDVNTLVWMYRSNSCDGWAVSAACADKVLAFIGGSGAYSTAGLQGETWANLKAHTHTGGTHTHAHGDHVHQTYSSSGAGDHCSYYNAAGAAVIIPASDWPGQDQQLGVAHESGDYAMRTSMYTALTITVAGATSGATGNTGAQSTADVRPAAAVGTLQYPDI
jgi:hypothetical protein